MVELYSNLRALCRVIADSASKIGPRQAATSPETLESEDENPVIETFWGTARENNRAASKTKSSQWYHAIEEPYQKLERIVRTAPPSLCDRVARDSYFSDMEPVLHQVRAAYEFDKETALAATLVKSREGEKLLKELCDQEAWWALSTSLKKALQGCKNVAVAGSGPLPLTALCIARELAIPVACIECDAAAFELGRKVFRLSAHSDLIHPTLSDISELQSLDQFDAVVSAVLVGVDMETSQQHQRGKIAENLVTKLRPGARLILKEPHGLGRLFHPPLNLNASPLFEAEFHFPPQDPGEPYQSGIAVLHRSRVPS